jgi:hypothetical protein
MEVEILLLKSLKTYNIYYRHKIVARAQSYVKFNPLILGQHKFKMI